MRDSYRYREFVIRVACYKNRRERLSNPKYKTIATLTAVTVSSMVAHGSRLISPHTVVVHGNAILSLDFI